MNNRIVNATDGGFRIIGQRTPDGKCRAVLHVPREYIEDYFGGDIDAAKQAAQNGDFDEGLKRLIEAGNYAIEDNGAFHGAEDFTEYRVATADCFHPCHRR